MNDKIICNTNSVIILQICLSQQAMCSDFRINELIETSILSSFNVKEDCNIVNIFVLSKQSLFRSSHRPEPRPPTDCTQRTFIACSIAVMFQEK